MHSSRMRTVISSGRLSGGGGLSAPVRGVCFGGGCLLPGGCLLLRVSAPGGSAPRGVSAPGGGRVCSQGVSAPRGCLLPGGGVVSQHALGKTPPPPVDRQTPVKT